MEADTDSSLVVRAQAGDRDAFGVLVERYMRRAYRQALALVGSREDALDLSQEAFARAYRARQTIDPGRPFYAWFHQILRRLCLNFLRDTQARTKVVAADGTWIVVDAAARDDPAAAIELGEMRRALADAIQRLPPHEREILVLKEFEELKYREIAALLDIPVGTVMSRLYSARRRLAEALEETR